MHFTISSAISLDMDQSKILSSGNSLTKNFLKSKALLLQDFNMFK